MGGSEAREYLKGKSLLDQKLIDVAYGRRWGSKPILIPLHAARKIVEEAKKEFPLKKDDEGAFIIYSLRLQGAGSMAEQLKEVIDWFERWFSE